MVKPGSSERQLLKWINHFQQVKGCITEVPNEAWADTSEYIDEAILDQCYGDEILNDSYNKRDIMI